jgi:hypothetical protein
MVTPATTYKNFRNVPPTKIPLIPTLSKTLHHLQEIAVVVVVVTDSWTGNSQLLRRVSYYESPKINRYFESFLRGSAVFLHLASKNMISTA